jgi:hypothetical protein
MIRGKKQARTMGKFIEIRGLSWEEVHIQTQNDTRKGESKNNGIGLREERIKEKVRYIQTQNYTRKRASKKNGEVFTERRVKERRGKHSHTK